MIRWVFLFCVLAWGQFARADDGINLELGIQPGRVVKSTIDSAVEMAVDLKGDDKIIEMNRQRGINFPLNISSRSKKIFTLKTSKADDNGMIQFVQKLLDSSSDSRDKDGKLISMPDPMKDFIGLGVNGALNRKFGMRLAGITGKMLPPDQEQAVKVAFSSQLPPFSEAPIGPLKIGDSFEKQSPFALPMAGQQPMQFRLTTKYTLKRIQGKMAFFDVALTFNKVDSMIGAKIDMTSSGSGTMEYNLETKLQEKLSLAFEMDLKAQEGNATVSSKMKSTSTTLQEITGEDGQP